MMEANDRSQRERPAGASAGEAAAPKVRLKMRLALTQCDVPPRWPSRSIEAGDTKALALLMYNAYHGTG
jgi:hypothetical protein